MRAKPITTVKLPRALHVQGSLNVGEEVHGLASGLRAIVARDFLHSVKHQEQHLRAVRENAHPHILLFEKKFLAKMRKLGIPMFAYCVWRDEAEQTRQFIEGDSRAKFGESAHNFGMGIDLIHGVHGWDISKESWSMIGHIGKEIAVQAGIKLDWGGDWRFYDPAHFELRNWKELAGL